MAKITSFTWALVSLGLAAATAYAQTTTQTYRQTGNLVGASASVNGVNYTAYVNIRQHCTRDTSGK
jgi:hypothetical protein